MHLQSAFSPFSTLSLTCIFSLSSHPYLIRVLVRGRGIYCYYFQIRILSSYISTACGCFVTFPEYRCGEVDSCACLLSRQENHRAKVKKHVLPNVSPFETACPESRLKRFSRRRSPTGRNLKNAWKPSESAGKEVVGRGTCGHERMGRFSI